MKTVIISCIFLLASRSYLHAEDCTKQFTIGEFGIPQSDSVVQKPVAFKDEPYIPQCIRKPPNGIFIGLEEQKYKVTGDLIRYGWYTYFWEGNSLREILTSD